MIVDGKILTTLSSSEAGPDRSRIVPTSRGWTTRSMSTIMILQDINYSVRTLIPTSKMGCHDTYLPKMSLLVIQYFIGIGTAIGSLMSE